MTAAQRNWVCTQCGSTKRGPARPRKDATVRFCLDCSAQSIRLVMRTCPSKEKRTAARAASAKAQRSAAAARKRTRFVEKFRVGPYDLIRELYRFWQLPSIREARNLPRRIVPGAFQHTPPTLNVRRRRTYNGTSGRAWARRIHLTVGCNPEAAIIVLLHEVVHAALPQGDHHSARFWAYYAQACEEAFDIKKVSVVGRTKAEKQAAIGATVEPVLEAQRIAEKETP